MNDLSNISADPTESLWNALTSKRCSELVGILRGIDEQAAQLRAEREGAKEPHVYDVLMAPPVELIRNRDEIRERFALELPLQRRVLSLDEQMADDVGIPTRGEI